jgi:hypothetical protein
VSPDGTRVLYVAEQGSATQLYLRQLDQFEAKAVPGTSGARHPFFSPDGNWIGSSLKDRSRRSPCPVERRHGSAMCRQFIEAGVGFGRHARIRDRAGGFTRCPRPAVTPLLPPVVVRAIPGRTSSRMVRACLLPVAAMPSPRFPWAMASAKSWDVLRASAI